MPTLVDFCQAYFENRPASPVYTATVLRRAKALAIHAGHEDLTALLTEAAVNAFLASLGVAPHTKKGYRGDLLMLWRAAADDGLAPYPITRRIRRERLPAIVVECFAEDEARALVAAATKLRGGLPNGTGRRHYWPAMIRVAWDSGLRRGDLWRLRRDAIRRDGSMLVAQNKTGKLVLCRLRPSTIAALDAIGGAVPLAWPQTSWNFGERFQALIKLAGVNRGTFRWLRRASGSYVEAAQPGSGHKHLGHATAAVFNQHYDARLNPGQWPLPPEL